MLKRFIEDQSGTTAIEYALLATFVSITIVTAITQIGSKLASQYITTVGNNLK